MPTPSGALSALAVADWRRRVFAMYERVRTAPDAASAHAEWVATRDELFRSHAASPLLPEDRDGFTGLPVADYDPAWRFELAIEAVSYTHLTLPTILRV